MMKQISIIAILLAGITLGFVSAHEHTTLYTRTTVPTDWIKGELAPLSSSIEFTLALKQRNLDILNKWFLEVSEPTHKNYQDYKSIDEINDLVSPPSHEYAHLMKWLTTHGVTQQQITNLGDAIQVKTNIASASNLFKTQFYIFHHTKGEAKIIRQFGSYVIPNDLTYLIEMVSGLSSFPIPHYSVVRNTNNINGSDAAYGVVPQTLFNLYEITQNTRSLINKGKSFIASQSVIEFQGQSFTPSDLTTFGQDIGETLQSVPTSQIIGPNDPTNPGDESTLDIEMIAGVDLSATNWFWLESGNGWLYEFTLHFFSTVDVPLVNSISYGWWEGDQCSIDQDECSQLGVDSYGYVSRVNVEFQKIGLRGVSLLVASGDSGANGRTDDGCTIPRLRPSFPGASPYVTAVGATELADVTLLPLQPSICTSGSLPCASTGTEQAVSYAISQFASGGGFSDGSPRPSYQDEAVTAYLNSGVALPPSSYFNSTGRGFPDVAAVGHNLMIVDGGSIQAVGGTSASTPIFSAVISLLNVASNEKTGKPLGFLNPLLYKMAAEQPNTFHDVTIGDNKCTEQGCTATCMGYECAKGWDPVTGLGSPNYANMLAYIQQGKHIANKRQ